MRSFRRGYRRYPVCVRIATPDGTDESAVLKMDLDGSKIATEAKLLPVLDRLGLPVPKVLAGPAKHPNCANHVTMLLLSLLPGGPLPWVNATLEELDMTCRLVLEGVARMHSVTQAIKREEAAKDLPREPLSSVLERFLRGPGPWSQERVFVDTVERLAPALAEVKTPLVFTNGDYNTFNFLCDGSELTGIIDFGSAGFQDPHIPFAHYMIWSLDEVGWGAGRKIGLVERYLYSRNVSQSEFAPRLALRCLQTLQSEIPVSDPDCGEYREHVLNLLAGSVAWLR